MTFHLYHYKELSNRANNHNERNWEVFQTVLELMQRYLHIGYYVNIELSYILIGVGDWAPRIWHEDLREGCLMELSLGEANLTGGCWSPTKMNAFFTIDENGKLNCYDLTLNHKYPVLVFDVSNETLCSIKTTDNGQKCYIGDVSGSVREILLPTSLHSEKRIERAAFHGMIERELKREKLVDSKKREAKLEKKRNKEDGGPSVSKNDTSSQKTEFVHISKRNPRIEEINAKYLQEMNKSNNKTNRMYAEMIHHARTLFHFDERGLAEIQKGPNFFVF